VRIERSRDFAKANELNVIWGQSIKNLVHCRRIALAARILVFVQLAADIRNDNLVPELFDPRTQFKGSILQRRNIRLTLCIVDPRKRLPKVSRGFESAIIPNDFFGRTIFMWRNCRIKGCTA
jgi:hypothetical protein